ncbi:MAG: hypothetical protein ACUVWP_02550 [bacterium]
MRLFYLSSIFLSLLTFSLAMGGMSYLNIPITSEKPNSNLDIPLNWFHIVNYWSHSSSHSWYCGPKENTKHDETYSLGYDTALYSPRMGLDQGAKKITLTFWHELDTSNDYNGGDIARIIVDSAQIQPTVIYEKNSPYNTNGWKQETLDLTNYRGQTDFQIIFVFDPDEDTNVDYGWYIDDILIESQLSQIDLIPVVEFDEYLPPGWSQDPPSDDTNDWHQYNLNMDWVARRYYQPYEMNSVDELISPTKNALYFTTLYLDYWTLYDKQAPYPNTKHAKILGSIDGGVTWPYEIKYYGYDDFTGTENVNITTWAAGKTSLRFKFRLECSEPENVYTWALDSIRIYGDMLRRDIDENVENGRNGWKTIPREDSIVYSSIGNIKALFNN